MASLEEIPEGDYLEAQLLADPVSQADDEEAGDLGRILYKASFTEMENSYVNYDTVQWILISLLLILVYGVGLLMLLYVPIRRYVVRQDIRTRKLYVTTNAIVYKVTRPVFLPCFGLSRREKHVLLHLVTDVVIEQAGCLQSYYGISSIRIEGLPGQNRPTPGDDVRIQGMANPRLFKKVVLMATSNVRKQIGGEDPMKASGSDDSHIYETPPPPPSHNGGRNSHAWAWRQGIAGINSWQMAYSPLAGHPNEHQVHDSAVLRRLEGIEASVKVSSSIRGPRHESDALQNAVSVKLVHVVSFLYGFFLVANLIGMSVFLAWQRLELLVGAHSSQHHALEDFSINKVDMGEIV